MHTDLCVLCRYVTMLSPWKFHDKSLGVVCAAGDQSLVRVTARPAQGWEGLLRGAFRRPDSITESTRWLFAGMALLALLIGVPAPLFSGNAASVLLISTATVAITVSTLYAYANGRVPFGLDLLDALSIAAFTMAAPNPNASFGCLYTAVWFRAAYGTGWRSLVRCGVYSIGVVAGILLWPVAHPHQTGPPLGPIVGTLPLLLVVLGIARWLARGLQAREEGLRRNLALGRAGSQLLGVTDGATIRAMGWQASTEVCAATPGLRIIKAVADGAALRTDGSAGEFLAIPARLPASAVPEGAEFADTIVVNKAVLDAATDEPLVWICTSLGAVESHAWLFLGAPKGVPAEAVLAVHSLVNQVGLALRTSRAQQELQIQADRDPLTGLANRASFAADLSLELANPTRAAHVLLLDLDNFKNVNDTLGHGIGDNLLVEMAVRLRLSSRIGDTCARLGGDEFAVLMRNSDDAGAMNAARRMVDAISEPIVLGGRSVRTTVSIGVVAATAGLQIEELIHHADIAMYMAKRQGAGHIQLFDPALLAAEEARLALERQLAGAAEAGELVVHYQPILALPDLRCNAVEALVRWQHPLLGLLQPGSFIDIAERTGAIVGIGAFVLEKACTDGQAWRIEFPKSDIGVHVNVSVKQLEDDSIVATVVHALFTSGLPASYLVLELTESLVLESAEAIERIKELAELGVQIAIDDFGTGYASLSTLRDLPISVVKIDRSFVAGARKNPVDRIVVKAITELGKQLGLHVVAEGIEHHEEQQFLKSAGVSAVQGFLYRRPAPAADLTDWLYDNLGDGANAISNVVAILRPPRR
jgi:diguanylate cyclase (GGDEF)-like protein